MHFDIDSTAKLIVYALFLTIIVKAAEIAIAIVCYVNALVVALGSAPK